MSNYRFYRPRSNNRLVNTKMARCNDGYTSVPMSDNISMEDSDQGEQQSCISMVCESLKRIFGCICPDCVLRFFGCSYKGRCRNATVISLVFIASLFGLEEDVIQRLQRKYKSESTPDLGQERHEGEKLEEEIHRKNLEEQNRHYQSQIDELKKELDNFKAKEESLITENRILRYNFETVKKEKETALSRLSAIAGSKLRHNNPGIADLSDENRPNKLAEKFNELYDNEWTEAFEALEKYNLTEYEIIAKLLACVKEIYYRCKAKAAHQREQLCNTALIKVDGQDSSDNSLVLKKISDLQKQISIEILGTIIQEFKSDDTFLQHFKLELETCPKYIEAGIQLCWLMNVQDPPVVLNFNFNAGDDMDCNVVKAYTKTGTKVDFLVWPPMLLHEAGPLLQKGVLQPI